VIASLIEKNKSLKKASKKEFLLDLQR
jgi:hypothetical protein